MVTDLNKPTEKAVKMEINGETYPRLMIAELSGVVVFTITAANGLILNAKIREAIYREIAEVALENLLIFIDSARTINKIILARINQSYQISLNCHPERSFAQDDTIASKCVSAERCRFYLAADPRNPPYKFM